MGLCSYEKRRTDPAPSAFRLSTNPKPTESSKPLARPRNPIKSVGCSSWPSYSSPIRTNSIRYSPKTSKTTPLSSILSETSKTAKSAPLDRNLSSAKYSIKLALTRFLSGCFGITEPEIRRMIIAIVWPKMNKAGKILLWSFWRRRHQAIAKYYHYKKRIKSNAQSLLHK